MYLWKTPHRTWPTYYWENSLFKTEPYALAEPSSVTQKKTKREQSGGTKQPKPNHML